MFTALVVDFGSHRRPWGCVCSWGGSHVSPQVLPSLPGSDLPPSPCRLPKDAGPQGPAGSSLSAPTFPVSGEPLFLSWEQTQLKPLTDLTSSGLVCPWASHVPRLYLVCDPAVPTALLAVRFLCVYVRTRLCAHVCVCARVCVQALVCVCANACACTSPRPLEQVRKAVRETHMCAGIHTTTQCPQSLRSLFCVFFI